MTLFLMPVTCSLTLSHALDTFALLNSRTKLSLFAVRDENDSLKAPFGQPTLPRRASTMAAAPPATSGPPAITPPIVPPGPPTWEELFTTPDWAFALPAVPYGMFLAAIFNSVDPPETLLNKLEQTALESPVVVALVLDEDPNWSTLLQNPWHFVGSLMHPTPLNSLIYGFSGLDTQRLAAVHILATAFEISTAFNILDDAAVVCLGLDSLPADQCSTLM